MGCCSNNKSRTICSANDWTRNSLTPFTGVLKHGVLHPFKQTALVYTWTYFTMRVRSFLSVVHTLIPLPNILINNIFDISESNYIRLNALRVPQVGAMVVLDLYFLCTMYVHLYIKMLFLLLWCDEIYGTHASQPHTVWIYTHSLCTYI